MLISLRSVTRTYKTRDGLLEVLKKIDLDIDSGDFIAISGKSGSGKSTLLNIIGLIDEMTSGTYLFNGRNVSNMSSNEKANYRSEKIGFIFQNYNLLYTMTAYENVELPLGYIGINKSERHNKVMSCFEMVTLTERVHHRPADMSGGEQQRVAIARVMAMNPDVILADEPTGNLDPKTTDEIMEILKQLNNNGKTILLVTHDDYISSYCKKRLIVENGIII